MKWFALAFQQSNNNQAKSSENISTQSMWFICAFVLPASAKEASAMTLFSWSLIGQGFSLLSVTSQGRKASSSQWATSISNCRRDKEQLAASAGPAFFFIWKCVHPHLLNQGERLPDVALWSWINVLAFSNWTVPLLYKKEQRNGIIPRRWRVTCFIYDWIWGLS